MKIWKISQFQYKELNLEEDDGDSDLYGQAEEVFRGSPVRPSNKATIRDIVADQGIVIGATSEQWIIHNGENEAYFSFDIVIKEPFRGQKIGTNLIERAIRRYEMEKHDYQEMGYETEMKLEAINLKLSEFLIREFGFEVEMKLSDRVILKRE